MENLSQSTRTPYYEESIREKITFIIRNKNKKQSKKVQIFGAVKDLTDSNLDKDITITVFKSTHLILKISSLSNPIKIKGLRYKTSGRNNIKNWDIFYYNPLGEPEEISWCPANYFSAKPENINVKEMFAPDFKLVITPEVFIDFEMEPNSALALEFIIEKCASKKEEEINRERFFMDL